MTDVSKIHQGATKAAAEEFPPRVVFTPEELGESIVKISDLPNKPPNIHQLLITGKLAAYIYYPRTVGTGPIRERGFRIDLAHYRKCTILELQAMTPAETNEIYIDLSTLPGAQTSSGLKNRDYHPPGAQIRKGTKLQELVKERVPLWRSFCEIKLANDKNYPMAKAIFRIQSSPDGRRKDGTPFPATTIRKHIKELFSGKPGRPPKQKK